MLVVWCDVEAWHGGTCCAVVSCGGCMAAGVCVSECVVSEAVREYLFDFLLLFFCEFDLSRACGCFGGGGGFLVRRGHGDVERARETVVRRTTRGKRLLLRRKCKRWTLTDAG